MQPASSPAFNASHITNRFVVGGGIVSADEVTWLQQQGVTHIISAAAELDDAAHFQREGLSFLHIPWQDDGAIKPTADFLTALRFAVDADAQRANHAALPVFYVHCAQGHNRGPLLATFLLAALSGLPADAAYMLIKAMRPVVTAFEHPHYRASCGAALDLANPLVATPPQPAQEESSAESQVAQSLKSDDHTATAAAPVVADAPHSLTLADGGAGHAAGVEEPTAESASPSKRARN